MDDPISNLSDDNQVNNNNNNIEEIQEQYTPIPDDDDEPNYFVSALKQTAILLKKNCKLAYRKKITTGIQLAVPFFFVLGLYLIQLAVDEAMSSSKSYANLPHSYSEPVPPIPHCQPNLEKGSYCYTFVYSPNTSLVNDLIEGVMADSNILPSEVKSFQSADQLNSFLLLNPNISQAAYVFNETYLNDGNGQYVYDIQYNGSCINTWSKTAVCLPPVESIIAPMQVSMDREIIRYQKTKDLSQIGINTPPTVDLNWNAGLLAHPKTKPYNIVTDLGSIFFFASLMFQFVIMLQDMVVEKETKLKEGMRMMGLKELAYYISWFVTYTFFILMDVLVLIATGFIVQFQFFIKNDFGTYFFLFILFGLSIICFAFFLSSLLRKSHTATFLGFFLFILFSILQAFIPDLLYISGKPYSVQAIFSLFSPIVFAKGLTDLAKASDYAGLRWKDINSHADVFPLQLVYRWIVLDGVIFVVLGWYIDNVFPGEFGTPKPFYFFLLPSYWTGKTSMPKNDTSSKNNGLSKAKQTPVEDEDVRREETAVAEMGRNSNSAVIIKNLVKVYRNNIFFKTKKDFYAVKGLSLSMEKNQLFCLLGPNGAGKTTTLSMLTGLFGPSEGDAYIFGHSINSDMTKIRKFMGVCPQHDLLWSHMTGREHLELYAAFKNIPANRIKQEAEERLKEVGIMDIADQYTTVYSGGERRRLSVAIAMTGNPKIIFLDEPTTGMDTLARRQVWNIIQNAKKNRCLCLTTHSMEEADILSDRIGIMAMGRLRCLGDNLHLKNKFGAGYKVTVFLKNNNHGGGGINKAIHNKVINFFMTTLEGSTVINKSMEQITFSVPRHLTSELPYFLETLEVNQNILNIQDVDVNLSTLEEVFLKIAEDAENEKKNK
eukprot:gene5371-6702_t